MFKKLLLLCISLALVFTFASCKEESEKETVEEEYVEVMIEDVVINVSDYESFFADSDMECTIAEEEIDLYRPTSLTVTMYDSLNSVYGFTYNTKKEPVEPVIQIIKIDTEELMEYPLAVEKRMSYKDDERALKIYICKAEIDLEPNSGYVYRVYDKQLALGSEKVAFKTKRPDDKSFTFAHVSDTQAGPDKFKLVLSSVTDKVDFLVHTGDVVETSRKESDWTAMLDSNFEYLSKIPVMAISGNHEVGYKNCSYETYKRFHNNIPEQKSAQKGYFYSFVYGNAKFIMLNTNDLKSNMLKEEQYNWLVNELSTNTSKWTIVSLHNPLYSVGKYGSDPERNAIALALQEQLRALFDEYNVDFVLQGHDHCISRTYPIKADSVIQDEVIETINGVDYSVNPDGVIYIMNGTSGKQARAPIATDETLYSYTIKSNTSSWAEITCAEDTLTVEVKYHDGEAENTYCKWGIKK